MRKFYLTLLLLLALGNELMALSVSHLKVNAVTNPYGLDTNPAFSWILESDERGCTQKSYKILIWQDGEDNILFDSGFIESKESVNVLLDGLNLFPSTCYNWVVTVRDNKGLEATSSEQSFFVTGLFNSGWDGAQWITAKSYDGSMPRFRKQLSISKPIKKAFLYSSALGVYDVYINGYRVGKVDNKNGTTIYNELKPGWTDYRNTVNYNTFDVTPYLKEGVNVIGSLVANGWWKGRISVGYYGDNELAFLAKMVVFYEDNSKEIFITDKTWISNTTGPLLLGDIWDGEEYDATKEDNWMEPDSDLAQWQNVEFSNAFKGQIVSLLGADVISQNKYVQIAKSVTIYEGIVNTGNDYGVIDKKESLLDSSSFSLKKGQTAIIDFGQNIVGRTPFTIIAPPNTHLRIRYAEMLNDDGSRSRGNDGPGGSLYLENLRSAKASLYYTFKGGELAETYTPLTTFYGFRYCELTANSDIEIKDIYGEPLSSITEEFNSFATDNPSVNQLVSNIMWGQRGNFISVPTDCPQRDERYGWTGDAQVFSRTGMYNVNTETFYNKYLHDLRDCQSDDGRYPDQCPAVYESYGNAGWSDAGIIVPWNLYLMYGNKSVLYKQYDAMEKYMSWLSTQTGDGYNFQGARTTYGDWLAFDKCDNRYVSVAYYAYDAWIMEQVSHALSENSEDVFAQKAQAYHQLFESIKAEFNNRYWNPLPANITQTTLLLPLAYDLLDAEKANYACVLLRDKLKENNGLLSTGFLGTAVLLPVLSKYGMNDEAYGLLKQRNNPSWLYSVDQGATTIWERWDSYTIEKGFGPASMNSFNHYAYGAVGEWFYRYVAGIDIVEGSAGFSSIKFRPMADFNKTTSEGQIKEVKSSYYSNYGKILSSYKVQEDGSLDYSCEVPVNTSAILYYPFTDKNKIVFEGNQPAKESDGVKLIEDTEGYNVYELQSGKYHFYQGLPNSISEIENSGVCYRNKELFIAKDGENTPQIIELFNLRGNLLSTLDKNNNKIDLGVYNKGVYLIKVVWKDKIKTFKFCIED